MDVTKPYKFIGFGAMDVTGRFGETTGARCPMSGARPDARLNPSQLTGRLGDTAGDWCRVPGPVSRARSYTILFL